jgi:DNA-binding MarR family transcriptional regulator
MTFDTLLPDLLPMGGHDIAMAPRPLSGDRPAGGHASDAIATLRATLLALVRRDGRDLTARQLTVFMTVYLEAQPHNVGSMADLLNVSRPGVTRILDRLSLFGLVERQQDGHDRRRVLIRRTERGLRFLRELEDIAAGLDRN